MIEVQGLGKRFQNFEAVQNVDFQVQKGETLMLIGTSGSGKTTTLKMINRLIEPSSGKILIHGENIMNQKPVEVRRKIGYVIQNVGLFPHYTIAQNIAVIPKLFAWKKNKIDKRASELMEMLDLPLDLLKRFPHELSGGQRQRVGVARALAVNPDVMLLDEPFGALDPITRHQIQHEFENIESLKSKTMVMVTHDVFEAVEMGDKIALMDKGKLQQLGTPKELIFEPKNAFIKSFFDSQRFELELKVTRLKDILTFFKEEDEEKQDIKTIQFSEKENLLTVLEQSAHIFSEKLQIEILDAKRNIVKKAPRTSLLPAFYKMKEQYEDNLEKLNS